MKSYNGFTGLQRERSTRWINKQIALGLATKPTVCCACSQDQGVLDWHAEDYSEPFGAHLFKFPLCFACHMMVHCRFDACERWGQYRRLIARGWRSEPYMTRGFGAFKSRLLVKLDFERFEQGPIPTRLALEEIEAWAA